MKYDVFFPTPIESITDPLNDNVDVCVTTADGQTYTLVFITPDNLKYLMESNREDFLSPMFKYIVVKRIEESIIRRALDEIVCDDSTLAYYGKN
ncbi:MAG: hypothetical protein IJA91_04940 [Clostridia bacterium]|nr:hypothetical protein [Clostridia bacterium]